MYYLRRHPKKPRLRKDTSKLGRNKKCAVQYLAKLHKLIRCKQNQKFLIINYVLVGNSITHTHPTFSLLVGCVTMFMIYTCASAGRTSRVWIIQSQHGQSDEVRTTLYELQYLSRNSRGCIREQTFENRVKSDSIRTYPNYYNITQRNCDTYIILANQILAIDSIF